MLSDCDFYYISNVGIYGETAGEYLDRLISAFDKLADELWDIPTYIRNGWCEDEK
jgi:hypothetical protein